MYRMAKVSIQPTYRDAIQSPSLDLALIQDCPLFEYCFTM